MKTITLISSFMFIIGSFAQDVCFTDNIIEQHLHEHPYATEEWIHMKMEKEVPKSSHTYSIPIVFHLIEIVDGGGGASAISDNDVLDQLASLNEDFNALNSDADQIPIAFQGLYGDVSVEFCLATTKPDGSYTNGIERHALGINGWTFEHIDTFLLPNQIYNRDEYLNIFICDFAGDLETDNILGFAQPPLATMDANSDAVVISHEAFSANGRTITHEVGHFLGLSHIWGDDGMLCAGDPGGSDDGISDTPEQGGPTFACPGGVITSCGSDDMFMNFMDYTNDECSLLFTEGQVTQMHAVLEGFRSPLTNSTKCKPEFDVSVEIVSPVGTVCQNTYYPMIRVRNSGSETISNYSLEVYLNGYEIVNNVYFLPLDPGHYRDYSFEASNNVQPGTNTMESNVSSEVGPGMTDYPYNNSVSSNFSTVNTGSGLLGNYIERFDDPLFPPNGIVIQNHNNNATWERFQSELVACAVIDHSSLSLGEKNALVTTDYNINYLNPLFHFDYAYAMPPNSENDSLFIQISQDCGVNWFNLERLDAFDLSQGNTKYVGAVVEPADFNSLTIPLNAFNQLKKARFRILSVSGSGSKLYIDNIIVGDTTVLGINRFDDLNFNIFPNPTKNSLQVRTEYFTDFSFEIYNQLGKLLKQNKSGNSNEAIDINFLEPGVYWLKVRSADGSASTKRFVKYSS